MVNPFKSNALVISSKLIHGITKQLTIIYDRSQIYTVKGAKYLGVLLTNINDNKLNFYEHIDVLECKNAGSVAIITKLKQSFLNKMYYNYILQYSRSFPLRLWYYYLGLNTFIPPTKTTNIAKQSS